MTEEEFVYDHGGKYGKIQDIQSDAELLRALSTSTLQLLTHRTPYAYWVARLIQMTNKRNMKTR